MIFLYCILAVLVLFLIVLVINAVRCKAKARKLGSERTYASSEEQEYYLNRLAKMIRCKTISVKGSFDDTEFRKLRNVMEELFPLVHRKAEKMTFSDDCWMYKIPGKDTSRNIMLMSHHDVVAATGDWKHEPFSGEVAEDAIWGRGTVDTKTPLFAEFSAVEELLKEGYEPPCNLYIGSSHNEEIAGDGIPEALKYFEKNNITFELILDEGGAIIDPPMGGVVCNCAMLAIHEKGRHKIICTAEKGDSHTGLAANPETPVVRMSRFITEINTKNIFIRRIYPEVKAMFEGLAPYMVFPMRLIFANLWCFAPLLKVLIPKINAQAAAMIGTMCSFNDISSENEGKKCTASAFLRCVNDGDLVKDIAAMKKVAEKYGITMEDAAEGNEYHKPADFTKPQFAYVKQCVGEVFPQVAAAPFVLPAGTDARHFSDICPCVVRFAPIRIDNTQFKSVHSPNENIGVKAVPDAVAFYRHLLKNYK